MKKNCSKSTKVFCKKNDKIRGVEILKKFPAHLENVQ